MSEPTETPEKIRIEGIACWSCEQEFGFMTQLTEGHSVSVYCGICDAENVLDLEPFRDKETIFKSGAGGSQQITGGYQLPKRIQGRKP